MKERSHKTTVIAPSVPRMSVAVELVFLAVLILVTVGPIALVLSQVSILSAIVFYEAATATIFTALLSTAIVFALGALCLIVSVKLTDKINNFFNV